MNIKEVKYIYYGKKCVYLSNIEQRLEEELYNSEKSDENLIYVDIELKNKEEVKEYNALISPVIEINEEFLKNNGTVLCEECTEKYGEKVYHYKYFGSETKMDSVPNNYIETVENIINYKELKSGCRKKEDKNGCKGGCCSKTEP